MGAPVVMGGIHATFCRDEALEHADAVVTGEAESIWRQVLADARDHALRRVYEGGTSPEISRDLWQKAADHGINICESRCFGRKKAAFAYDTVYAIPIRI